MAASKRDMLGVVFSVCFGISLIILVITLWNVLLHASKDRKFVKFTAVFAILLYTTGLGLGIVANFDAVSSSLTNLYIAVCKVLLIGSANCLIYIIFAVQSHSAHFTGWKLCVFTVSLSLWFLANIALILKKVDAFYDILSDQQLATIQEMEDFTKLISGTVLCVLLIYVFLVALQASIHRNTLNENKLLTADEEDVDEANMPEVEENELPQQAGQREEDEDFDDEAIGYQIQVGVLSDVTKQTVLVFIATFSTETVILLAFIGAFMHSEYVSLFVVQFCLAIDTALKVICAFLLLSYPITSKVFRLFCGCCIRCVQDQQNRFLQQKAQNPAPLMLVNDL